MENNVKFVISESFYPPKKLIMNDIEFEYIRLYAQSKSMILSYLNKNMRKNSDISFVLRKAIEENGLTVSVEFKVENMKKKSKNGLMESKFLKLCNLSLNIMNFLNFKGFIVVNFKAYHIRFFYPKG